MIELFKRSVTGIILLAALFVALYHDGYYFKVLFLIAASVTSWEFYRMFLCPTKKGLLYFATILSFLLIVITFFLPIDEKNILSHPYSPALLMLASIIIATVGLFRWPRLGQEALVEGAIILSGIVYIPMAMALLLPLSTLERLYMFLLLAVNDTFAYLVGIACGKHKIWPAVSPKKSIEGSLGGLIASVVLTVIYCGHFGEASLVTYAILGAIFAVLGQLGDFFESALKRTAKVKDSSSILPGHGGVLDRLDSMLFVLPVMYLLYMIFPHVRF